MAVCGAPTFLLPKGLQFFQGRLRLLQGGRDVLSNEIEVDFNLLPGVLTALLVAYLQRKASGAQKRYEDKIKARKKAELDAKKNAIRAALVVTLDGLL